MKWNSIVEIYVEFGFHDFRHAADLGNQAFYVPASLLSFRGRVVIGGVSPSDLARFRFYRVTSARASPNLTKIGVKSDVDMRAGEEQSGDRIRRPAYGSSPDAGRPIP